MCSFTFVISTFSFCARRRNEIHEKEKKNLPRFPPFLCSSLSIIYCVILLPTIKTLLIQHKAISFILFFFLFFTFFLRLFYQQKSKAIATRFLKVVWMGKNFSGFVFSCGEKNDGAKNSGTDKKLILNSVSMSFPFKRHKISFHTNLIWIRVSCP